MKETTHRIFGLDLIRCFAIIIVVRNHSSTLLAYVFPNLPHLLLPDGVDLFFVLSGFLIGSILMQTLEDKKTINISIISSFLKRRWLRTLPNYFLFLLINVILIHYGLIKGELNKYILTFLVFFQNFYKPYDFLFWESWSLAIEEWFYLTFPLILFLFYTIKPFYVSLKKILFVTILFFLLFPLIYRFFHSHTSINDVYWDLYFRKLVLTRLDCIGFGLLGAFVKQYYSSYWSKYKYHFFIVGISLLYWTLNTCNNYSHFGSFLKTIYFSIIGFSILLVFPLFESLKKEKIPLKPFAFISKISFSMYLIHMPLLQILSNHFSHSNKIEAFFLYSIFWISLLLLSFLVYTFFEKPMMNLRRID